MITITLPISERHIQQFGEAKLIRIINDFLNDYLESKQDQKLKKQIEDDDEMTQIANQLASKL
jgi:hypothetical protein